MDTGSLHEDHPGAWEPIGDDHWISRTTRQGSDEITGLIDEHHKPGTTEWCYGGVNFDVPVNADLPPQRKWQVVSLEPLHIEPSLLCSCGDHGFIREGRWVAA